MFIKSDVVVVIYSFTYGISFQQMKKVLLITIYIFTNTKGNSMLNCNFFLFRGAVFPIREKSPGNA